MSPLNLNVIEQTPHELIFVIEGISIEMVNALRRIILTEIPVMAVDEVIILKNDSPLYDEILAHRIGLIPLSTDLDAYKLPNSCECSGYGCPLCQVSLTLEITNTTNTPIDIYSGDLKSNDPKIIPVDQNIPLVKIDKNNQVILEAYAILGIARDHAKWQAVSNVAFRYYPIVEFNENDLKDVEQKKLIVRMCPEKLFELTSKNTLKIKEDYWKTCNFCQSCEKNSDKKITVRHKENSYIFSIESDGMLPFNIIIKKSFEIFDEKINEFITKLEELEIES
ncbi:MAG: DNA-directed RNA polymerase subunit D [Candidatus Hodarchaeota archaeon]